MSGISEMIRKRRLELGLTLEEVGNSVGVGKATVRRWETGAIRNMGIDKVVPLADVLRIDLVDFMYVLKNDYRG